MPVKNKPSLSDQFKGFIATTAPKGEADEKEVSVTDQREQKGGE